MEIITALGNEEIARKIKEKGIADINKADIQYQEAVIEILNKNKDINLLILSSLLPGEKNIYEFINLIKYKNKNLEIIIILEKENKKIEEFLISKGIENIYYNNKVTINEILGKIEKIIKENNLKNKINKFEKINSEKNKININYYLKNKIIKNKYKYLKNKILKKYEVNINNKKIISIIGGAKVGKSVFSLFLSLNIKNKKILIIDFDIEKNNIKKIIGKKIENKKNIINWKKYIDVFIISKEFWIKNNLQKKENIEKLLNILLEKYEYIIIDFGKIEGKDYILKKSQKIILLVEANLLGISESSEILKQIIHNQKNQKDNVKIVYNKQSIASIHKSILDKIFSDFEILGQIKYNNFYNFFINTNGKYINKKINKEFLKISKKI